MLFLSPGVHLLSSFSISRVAAVLPLALLAGCLFQPTPYEAPEVVEVDPELRIVSPAAGAYVDEGTLVVQGEAVGLIDVRLNGEPVSVGSDGSFVHEMPVGPGVVAFELSGRDADGDERFIRQSVLAGTWANPDDAVRDGAVVRLNRGALEFIIDGAEAQIDVNTLAAAATTANPIYQQNAGLLAVEANLTSLVMDDLELWGEPTTGALQMHGVLPNVVATLDVDGHLLFDPFDAVVVATADQVFIDGDLLLEVGAYGSPVVTVTNVTAQVINMQTDTSGLPIDLDSGLIRNAIENQIENMLPTLVINQVPPVVQSQLDTLDLSFPLNVVGVSMQIDGRWGSVSIDPDGVVAGLDLEVSGPVTGSGDAPGYLVGGGSPRPSVYSDASVGLSDDLVNLLLFRAWQAGAMALELDTSALAGDTNDEASALDMIGDGTVLVQANLPPVVVQRGDVVSAMVGELGVVLDTPDGGLGERVEIAAAVTSGVDLGVADTDVILGLEEASVSLGTRYNDWGAVDNEALTRLLEVAVPVESVMTVFSDVTVPVPTIQGMQIVEVGVARDAGGLHTNLDIDI